jgi:hemolysin III
MSGPDLVAPPTAGRAESAGLDRIKPRLRGWLHTNAAIFSLASGATLIAVSASLKGGAAAAATAIYSATVTMLFASSALYHRYPWSPRAHQVMKRLDHSMIFVFIAGTYTPIAALALSGTTRLTVLLVVWIGAALGVFLQSGWPDAPRWLSVPCYIALGWVAIAVGPQLLDSTGVAALTLIVAGGIVYTLGGVVYALRRPDPVPAVFGFHEVFHLCTLVAAACHYIAIWLIVFN